MVAATSRQYPHPPPDNRIVLGHRARRKIRQTGERGWGLATAGLTLGYIGLGLIVVGLALLA